MVGAEEGCRSSSSTAQAQQQVTFSPVIREIDQNLLAVEQTLINKLRKDEYRGGHKFRGCGEIRSASLAVPVRGYQPYGAALWSTSSVSRYLPNAPQPSVEHASTSQSSSTAAKHASLQRTPSSVLTTSSLKRSQTISTPAPLHYRQSSSSSSELPANPSLTFERLKQLDELIEASSSSKKALDRLQRFTYRSGDNVRLGEQAKSQHSGSSAFFEGQAGTFDDNDFETESLEAPDDVFRDNESFTFPKDPGVETDHDPVYTPILRHFHVECQQAEVMLKRRILTSTAKVDQTKHNNDSRHRQSGSPNRLAAGDSNNNSYQKYTVHDQPGNAASSSLTFTKNGDAGDTELNNACDRLQATHLDGSPRSRRKNNNPTVTTHRLDPESAANLTKARYIIQELVDSEQRYVRELQMITRDYVGFIKGGGSEVPKKLVGKSNAVFGTWDGIERFHLENLLPLTQQRQSAEFENFSQIAGFLHDMFSLGHIQELEDYYFEYSRNLRAAFKLIQSPQSNPEIFNFFKATQRRLKQPLPIDAYLLIPVQRIAKYPLLVKKVVDLYSHQNETRLSLLRSHSAVHHLMQAVNNRLHASAINVQSLPKDVADTLTTGCHIHQQAMTTVQVEKLQKERHISGDRAGRSNTELDRKEPSQSVSRTLRMSRPAQRRIFLTDKFLLLTKARDCGKGGSGSLADDFSSCLDTLPGGSEIYDYKDVFDLVTIEIITGYGKRVIVSLPTHRYYFTFESEQDRELWKEVLEYRKTKRKLASEAETQGPKITSPTRAASKRQSSGSSSAFSSFRRALTRSSLRRKKSSAPTLEKTASLQTTPQRAAAIATAQAQKDAHRRQRSEISLMTNLFSGGGNDATGTVNQQASSEGVRTESSESAGSGSNFARNKVVTASFRLRQSQMYSGGVNLETLGLHKSPGLQTAKVKAYVSPSSVPNSSESSASRPSSMNFSE